jgi:uncharacterized membrane protein YccC
MKIEVPTPENSKKEKRKKIRNFIAGLILGIIVFGLIGSRVFWWGIDNVQIYTWIALGFGALSFGFLAMWFGNEFWQRLLGNN